MLGLTVRWSLVDSPEGVEKTLADYVAGSSHARFSGKDGLAFKIWRMRAGEWFEGCYVFASDTERESFQAEFTAGAAQASGSVIVGSAPILIEPCDIVATASGASGFVETADFR